MAYNVLKGNVSGSVDQHGNQEINGIKTFINVVSASMFYDTDAQSPCATENNVAIKKLKADTQYGILTYEGDGYAKSHYNLSFDGVTLRTHEAIINSLSGDGTGLLNVPAEHLSGKLLAKSLNLGSGLESFRDALKIKANEGLETNEEGLSLSLSPNGGLSIKNKKLVVDCENSLDVKDAGQNISDPDLLLMYDASRGEVRHTTFKNLYDGFVVSKVPHPDGVKNSVQYKGNKYFEGTERFTYDPSSGILSIKGAVKNLDSHVSRKLESNGQTHLNGSLFKPIKKVHDSKYDFQDTDHTVLFDTGDNNVVATLPPARENAGRVIIIKKINNDENKYKVRGTHSLKIKTEGELIDFSTEISLKSNYSTRTIQSDGDKWWIINRSGS
tara:strand:+ start:4874 stop:6028 length:1155 start_codon:yes stop_codon:yes gene_type:complete